MAFSAASDRVPEWLGGSLYAGDAELIFALARVLSEPSAPKQSVNDFHRVLHERISRHVDQFAVKLEVDFQGGGIRQFVVIPMLQEPR